MVSVSGSSVEGSAKREPGKRPATAAPIERNQGGGNTQDVSSAHQNFRGREKKGPCGPSGFLVLMTRRQRPATSNSAPRARRCARSTAPTRPTPSTPPPGSYHRHAGASAPLHPGTSRDSNTHIGCHPYPPHIPITELPGWLRSSPRRG